MPPSSSGLGYLVLSQGTGVRVPVGVLQIEPADEPAERKGDSHEWHSVKPNTLGLKVLRQKTPAHRPMINNMISISLDGKPCVSEAYSVIVIHTSINIMLIRVERKSLIRKTLILIRVPFETATS